VPWGRDLWRAVGEAADPGPVPAFAALFARPRSAAGLAWYLGRRFDLPVRVAPAEGDWVAGPHRDYDPAFACQVVLGPVTAARFRRLLPGGGELPQLLRAARAYTGPEVRFTVAVLLSPTESLPARLGEATLGHDLTVAGVAGPVAAAIDFATCRAEEAGTQTSRKGEATDRRGG
jgi:predicted component of type VI protein secretion system